jgi:hypothetical protein
MRTIKTAFMVGINLTGNVFTATTAKQLKSDVLCLLKARHFATPSRYFKQRVVTPLPKTVPKTRIIRWLKPVVAIWPEDESILTLRCEYFVTLDAQVVTSRREECLLGHCESIHPFAVDVFGAYGVGVTGILQ